MNFHELGWQPETLFPTWKSLRISFDAVKWASNSSWKFIIHSLFEWESKYLREQKKVRKTTWVRILFSSAEKRKKKGKSSTEWKGKCIVKNGNMWMWLIASEFCIRNLLKRKLSFTTLWHASWKKFNLSEESFHYFVDFSGLPFVSCCHKFLSTLCWAFFPPHDAVCKKFVVFLSCGRAFVRGLGCQADACGEAGTFLLCSFMPRRFVGHSQLIEIITNFINRRLKLRVESENFLFRKIIIFARKMWKFN